MLEKKQRVIKKLTKSKLFMSVFVVSVVVMMISGVFAVVYFGYMKSITGEVIGGESLSISVDFPDTFVLDVRDSSQVFAERLIINNPDSAGNFTNVMNITFNPTDPTCDYDGDLDVALFGRDGNGQFIELNNDADFSIYEGDNKFDLNITALHRSCSGDLIIDIEFVNFVP